MEKILLGLSGGVDSSVAIHILRQKGYEVVACTLDMIRGSEDYEDAITVAEAFDCAYHILDYRENFYDKVVINFAKAYEEGMTPNPCVYCNRYVKLAGLMEQADSLGIKYVATGHYARVEYSAERDRYCIRKGKDIFKDQSYMLYNLSQEQLARVVFPLGDMTKEEIRAMAEEMGLVNARKKDSQDICFVPEGQYAEFLEKNCGIKSSTGKFLDTGGNVIGEHRGIIHYTVGQRKGLGQTFGKPMYVIGKDSAKNTVTLGESCDLMFKVMLVKDINLIAIADFKGFCRVLVKARYSMKEAPAEISWQGEYLKVVFDKPQRALTPGQAAVFFDENEPGLVLGGGTIRCVLEE